MTSTRERQGRHLIEAIEGIQPIVRDEVLTIGAQGELVGILSHPPGGRWPERSERPEQRDGGAPPTAFILLNAGVLHRVGPHRLHVALARRLAATGSAGLRLDLGGIGDSVASSDAATFRDSAVADTRAAMTGVTAAVGAEQFVLLGVCAGADNALATALVDERVAGIVLIDPPAYPTWRGQLRDLRARVARHSEPLDVVRWGLGVAERRVRLAIAMVGRRRVEDPPSEGRELPPIETYRAQLTRLVERGVRILVVYSGIHGPRYNDVDQLFEWFPELRGRVDRAYFADANHTFTELAAQAALIDTISRWMAKRFG